MSQKLWAEIADHLEIYFLTAINIVANLIYPTQAIEIRMRVFSEIN